MSLSTFERDVCRRIEQRREAMLADLRLHVETPTGGRNLAALDQTREWLTSRARRLGATIDIIPGVSRPPWLYRASAADAPLPTAVCRRPGTGPNTGREVLLAGHLDTVHDPAGDFRSLTIAPDGATAVGPGCVDMKGGLVITLAALEALGDAGFQGAWTLVLNADEETGSYHSAGAIFDEARRVHAAGGVGIAVEPASGTDGLVVERPGSGQFMIEARGKSAHVGRDFSKGVSAVRLLASALLRVLDLTDPKRGVLVNIAPLEGGQATNVVPDLARAWGNVRFMDPADAALFEQQARQALRELCTGTGGSLDLLVSFARPAKPRTPETMRLAELAKGVADDLGQPMTFASTGGVCDGNIMQAAGLPTIDTLGVRGGGLHTTSEWIDLASIVPRCQLLALTILRASAR